MDKRGKTSLGMVAGIIVAIVVIILTLMMVSKGKKLATQETYYDLWAGDQPLVISQGSPMGYMLHYIFGITPGRAQTVGALVVFLAIFLIFALALADIMVTFGLFGSKAIGAIIGILIAIILANMGYYYYLFSGLMNAFAILSGFAVVASLASVLVAAFAANWGIKDLAVWLNNRRVMEKVAKGEVKVSGGIRVLKKVAEQTAAGE